MQWHDRERHSNTSCVTHDARNAVGEVVEDDVPDGCVWMGRRLSGMFEERTW